MGKSALVAAVSMLALMSSGCAVVSVADAAVSITAAAVSTTVKVGAAAVDAVIPDGQKKEEKEK